MSQIACRVGKGEKGNFVVEIGSHVLIEIEKNTPIPIIGPSYREKLVVLGWKSIRACDFVLCRKNDCVLKVTGRERGIKISPL